MCESCVKNVRLNIHEAAKAIGLGLFVLFFVVGVMKTLGSFAEMKGPKAAADCVVREIMGL